MATIYAIHEYYTNNRSYDCYIDGDYVICAFSTREKAEEYINKLPLPQNNEEWEEEPWEERNPYLEYLSLCHVRHFCQKHYDNEDYDEIWYEIDELKYDEE